MLQYNVGEGHYILTLELCAIKAHVLTEVKALADVLKQHSEYASSNPPASVLINVSQVFAINPIYHVTQMLTGCMYAT